MREPIGRKLGPYSIALGSVATALVISLLTREALNVETPYCFFATAIVLSAYRGGVYVGLLATLISGFSVNYFILNPRLTLTITSPQDSLVLLLFLGEGIALSLLTSLLGSLQRHALRSIVARYGFALIAVLLAFLLKVWFARQQPYDLPFILFYSAVMVSVWIGGQGPGFLATGLSGALAAFYFYQPEFSFAVSDPDDAVRLMIFVFEGTLITLLTTTLFAAHERSDRLEREAVAARQQLEAREARLRRQNLVLLEMASIEKPETTDPHHAMSWLTETAARTLECDRVSVWLFDPREDVLRCIDLHERGKTGHTQGATLDGKDHPIYFAALKGDRTLAATDVRTDPRTQDLLGHLGPLGIVSVLHAPVRKGGQFVGVVCHELLGENRTWGIEEEQFGASIADLAALVLENCQLVQAEQRIREQALLLDQARDAILVEDGSGRIRYWNQGAERLYGWKASEVQGLSSQELFACPAPDAYLALVSAAQWSGELRHRTHNRSEVIVDSRWTRVSDAAGKPCGVLMINTDISEKKRIESRLLRTQRLESIGSLTSGIAHDLGNVLGPLSMGLDLLKQLPSPEERNALLDSLQQGLDRGRSLIHQVMAFVRGEGKRSRLNVASVLVEMQRFLSHTFPHTVSLQASIPPDLWPVWGDATQLYQVLLNLCVNARDAMPEGGTLSLLAENLDLAWGRHVRLQIRDTGCGIPEDIRSRIFEPFFTTKQPEKGTGLGLSTTRTLIEKMGGTIEVASEVGKGTTFTVQLPVASTSDSSPEHLTIGQASGRGEWILVVDDEASIRELARRTLEAEGYRVAVAKSEGEALTRLSEPNASFSAVLVNVMLPGANLIESVRQRVPRAAIIASTSTQAEAPPSPPGQGESAFLPKPYTAAALLRAIQRALERKQ